MKILFTSVGRRVELVQMFRRAADKKRIKLTIYGADISDSAPALAFCDKFERVCMIKDINYIPVLLDICKREQIDALIPTIDTDLMLLAENKEKFAEVGTAAIISAPEKVRICRDKRYTAAYFISCGLKSPVPVDDYHNYPGNFPCFIKPKDGSSSINAYKANSKEELKSYADRISDYIVQPFIEGTEYTVDIFCDFSGKPIFITPRERTVVRSGEVIKTQIFQDDRIISKCKALIADYKPCGAITVQLIRQKGTGDDYYIEINPRFGGGSPLSMKAGADSAEAVLRLLNGEQLNYVEYAATDKEMYSRFDQSVSVRTKDNIKPHTDAVIFDLDDTLYSEKKYVKSGFKTVAELLPQIEDAEKKLWKAFENGQPAIDTVLKDEGCYTEELKDICLNAYRNHKPIIYLYDGVKELLEELRVKGVKTGIITDGRPEGQKAKIKALGLEPLVDEIIITDDLGGEKFRKPCDIAFRIMQRRLNVNFENMVYVADNPEKDFLAPKTLGMQSLFFKNSDGLYSYMPTSYLCTVKSLNEMFRILLGDDLQ